MGECVFEEEREGGKWEVGVGWWEKEREGRSREGGRWE